MRNHMQPPSYYSNAAQKQKVSFHLPKDKLMKLTDRKVLISAGIVTANLLVLSGVYYAFVYLPAQNTPDAIARHAYDTRQQQNQDMLATVAKQIQLPKDEKPVLATISDVNALQNQTFFKQAQNGDRLLLYKQHKKIYLYRPSTKQVIAVAPLQFQDQTPAPPQEQVAGTATVSAQEDAAPNPTAPPHGKVLVQPQ